MIPGAPSLAFPELSDELRREWTAQVARPVATDDGVTESVLVFRLGQEWLALATESVERVAPVGDLHTLPSHRAEALRLANIEGELLVCVPLAPMLGAGPEPELQEGARLVVLGNRLTFVADEVHGVIRFDVASLGALPVTLADASRRFSLGLFLLDSRCVARLDDELVLRAMAQALA